GFIFVEQNSNEALAAGLDLVDRCAGMVQQLNCSKPRLTASTAITAVGQGRRSGFLILNTQIIVDDIGSLARILEYAMMKPDGAVTKLLSAGHIVSHNKNCSLMPA